MAHWRALAVEAEQLWAQGAFHEAGIGRDPARRLQARVRGDYTLWLDRQQTPLACQFVDQELEAVRCALNASACLGLFEFEGQLARYPMGTRYARHLDQLRDTQARQVSVVLYLNADWQSTEGGELCLYRGPPSADARIPILPRGGTLVLYASADTPHEVRPATRARLSLSGWLRRRA
ncbi:MAG: 2OG-Fe(II) oxygenase [Gammaproteobacteria bacterium]|nr:2OG-Fe(II) oxygenase [Gammaproteobacteria bacterium]